MMHQAGIAGCLYLSFSSELSYFSFAPCPLLRRRQNRRETRRSRRALAIATVGFNVRPTLECTSVLLEKLGPSPVKAIRRCHQEISATPAGETEVADAYAGLTHCYLKKKD